MRVVAGDVGGTKTLLCCVESSGRTSAEQRFESGGYKTFEDLLSEFVERCEGPIDAACFAVAGPVVDDHAEITNLEWDIDRRVLTHTFSIPKVDLINDFYAVALGVPLLKAHDLVSLNRGRRERTGTMAILGAGTGLGEAFVTFGDRDRWTVIPSEGGHADFAPQNEEQSRLFLHLAERYGHVSWERVLSGMGLTNIFSFLSGREEKPSRIAELADGGDEHALKTFAIFIDLYGAEAGNMALRILARGGVFLAGGIAARHVERFKDGRFMEAFSRKGRFRELLADMPVDLIANPSVGLLGAVEMARRGIKGSNGA
jgi:glucokinase